MADDEFEIELSYKNLVKELDAFNKDMPGVASRLMRAVNSVIRTKIQSEAQSRGYKADKQVYYKTLGNVNAGYKGNIKSYITTKNGYDSKIKILKRAFYYRYIEYGAEIPDRIIHVGGKAIRLSGFSYPANPLVYPIADNYWKTSKATQIMDEKMQDIIKEKFKEKK